MFAAEKMFAAKKIFAAIVSMFELYLGTVRISNLSVYQKYMRSPNPTDFEQYGVKPLKLEFLKKHICYSDVVHFGT